MQTGSTRYNQRFVQSYSLPDKEASGETVNKIFLKVSSGKYFDVKKTVAQERAFLNLHDTSKRSILHHILLNSDLSNNDKYMLVKDVVELGAPIDNPDINDVRPLHLASSQQNKKLVRFLLDKKAEVNSRDNNYMTPLHYAVSPIQQVCPAKPTKELVPVQYTPELRIDKLFDVMFRFFQQDKTLRMYITHIANLFKNRYVYSDLSADDKRLAKLVNETLSEKGGDIDSFKRKLIDFKKEIHNRTKSDLSKANSNIDFKEGTPKGWGPSVNGIIDQKRSVVPYAELIDAYMEIKTPFTKASAMSVATLKERLNAVNERIGALSTYVTRTSDFFNRLSDYFRFINIMRNIYRVDARFNRIDELRDELIKMFITVNGIISEDIQIDDLDFESVNLARNIINQTARVRAGRRANDVSTYSTLQVYIAPPHHPALAQCTGLGIIIDTHLDVLLNLYRKLSRLIDLLSEYMTDPTKEHGDAINTFGEIQLVIANMCLIEGRLENYLSKVGDVLRKFKIFYTTSGISQTFENVVELLKSIKEAHKNHPRTPFELNEITGARAMVRVASNVFIDVDDGNQVLVSYLDNRNSTYSFVLGRHLNAAARLDVGSKYVFQLAPGQPPTPVYDVRHEQTAIIGFQDDNVSTFVKNIDEIIELSGFTSDMGDIERVDGKNILVNLHENLFRLQESLLNSIDVYNQACGLQFLFDYNNKLDHTYLIDSSSPNFRTNNKTGAINSAMLNTLKKPTLIADSFRKFMDEHKDDISKPTHDAVKTFIDRYGLFLGADDVLTVVNSTLGVANRPKQTGLLSIIPAAAEIVTTPPNVVIGRFEEFNSKDFDKSVDPKDDINILITVADWHIFIIRLIVIMYSLQKLTDVYHTVNNAQPSTPFMKEIHNVMQTIHDEIETISSVNPFGYLLTMIAKVIDDIFLKTVDNISSIGAANYIVYLTDRKKITDRPFETLLAESRKLDDKKSLITKPDDKVRLRGSEILSSIVSSTVVRNKLFNPSRNPRDIDILQFFGRDDSHFSETDTMNRLIDFDSVDNTDDMCYSIDEDVVADLLKAGADPNIPERTGETPLSFAVLLQNPGVVELLLRGGAKVIFDKMGVRKNIYEFCFNQLLNAVEASPVMNVDELNTRVEQHLNQKTGMRNMFGNSKIILKMAAYLLDHQLTINANTYPNLWNKQQQDKINNLISLSGVPRDLIPLAKVDRSIIQETLEGYATMNQTLDDLRFRLTDEREISLRLDNSIRNLQAELRTLSRDDLLRRSEIDQLIIELTTQKTQIDAGISSLVKQINDLTKAISRVKNNRAVNTTTQQIRASGTMHKLLTVNKRSRDVTNIYDIFFDKIINPGVRDVHNSEYVTYIRTWNSLFARPDYEYRQDYTQMSNLLMRFIVERGIVDPDTFRDTYLDISDLYDKVLSQYGRDLLELLPYIGKDGESYHEKNYVLTQIYLIMQHVFKHTMSINFISTVAQLLARRDRGRPEVAVMRNIYQAMKTSEFIKHCIQVLPKQIIKVVCKISESDKDPDLSLNVTDVLNRSLDLLTINTFDNIDKNTIDQAKEIVVPFFVNYMEAYTAEMHQMMVRQIKLFTVQGRWLNMIKVLLDKTTLEMENK